MGIRIPDLLKGILEATAAEAAAKARIATLRSVLEDEGRRRLKAEGAAPSWNTPQLGKVRLDPPGAWSATVADEAAFGSFVAEHYSTEATTVLRIDAPLLEAALEALTFAGISPEQGLTVDVEVRPAWRSTYLDSLVVDVEETPQDDGEVERDVTIVDPSTGLLPAGVVETRTPAKLVVTLDRDRRTAAIEEAKGTAAALVEEATEGPAPDPVALDQRRRILEGMRLEALQELAGGLELGKSGTKAELAERVARAEAANGTLIVPDDVAVAGSAFEDEGRHAEAERAAGREVTLDEVLAEAHRRPYVEDDPDPVSAARRSANIDRSEADTYDREDPRRAEALASAERWERQAADLEQRAETAPGTPERIAERLDAGQPVTVSDVVTPEAIERHTGMTVEQHARNRNAELLDGLSREVLRRYTKAQHPDVSAAGTKAELIGRLVEAGVTVAVVNEFARRARA